jgi:cysteine-S-conjugate beta-lyase
VAAPEFVRPSRTSAKWGAFPSDVLPLWVAEMDFPLSPAIAAALHDAIDRSDTGYRWPGDLPVALSEFWQRRFGWAPEPERVVVLGDVLVAMAETIRRMTHGAVVITPPAYPPFFRVVTDVVGRELVQVPLTAEGLDMDGLERAFTRPDVTCFLLGNPHNPTGHVWMRAQLEQIALMARRHGVTVISDEIWAPLTMPGVEVTPYLSLDEELTGPDIALVSASKAFNLAGLKCAEVIGGSAQTAKALTSSIPAEVTYSAGHLGVIATIAAFRDDDTWLDSTREAIAANARLLHDLLREQLPAIEYVIPEATYLAWLDCRGLGLGDDPSAVFLERGRVALNPGLNFGTEGAGFARLNLATAPVNIEVAVARMRRAVG